MTPRSLDWRSVRAKLRKIDEMLDVLREIGTVDGERLRNERTTALVVERVITIIVEMAFAVNAHISVARLQRAPDTYAESFALAAEAGAIDRELAAALFPSAGMRNVLVHAYLTVDYDQVARGVPLALDQYGHYIQQVASWFADQG